jgi:hypothetical protein
MLRTHPAAGREDSEASAHRSDNGAGTTGPSAPAEADAAPALRAVHTPDFPALLRRLGTSLLVTTYQAGKLVMITDRLAEDERTCGVCVVELATGRVVAVLRFETGVQEVFAVALLPGRRWPELINDDDTRLENSFVVPAAAMADVPAALRA